MAGKVTVTMVADDQKAQQQVNKFFYNMEKNSKQAASRMGRLNQQFQKFKGDLKNYAIGAGIFGGIAASAKLAVNWVGKMNEEMERSESLSDKFASGLQKLNQLAETPEQMRELSKQVSKTRMEQGVSAQEAAQFVFKTHSAGVADKRKQLAQLLPVTDKTGQIVTGVGGLQAAFGKGEGGGVSAMAGKIVAASRQSPAGAGKMGKYAPRVAGFAAPIGAEDEETMAALAQTAEPIGGIEEAHTAVKAFARQLGKKGITEGGLIENVRRIKQKDMGPKQLSEYLGSSEAVQGYRQMANLLPEIRQQAGMLQQVEQRAGTSEGLIQKRRRVMREGAPHMWAQYQKRKAEAQEAESLRKEYGVEQTRIQTEFTKQKQQIRKKHGVGGWAFSYPSMKGAQILERTTDAEAGQVTGVVGDIMETGTDIASGAKHGPAGVIGKMWQNAIGAFTEEQRKTQEELKKTRESIEENTQSNREKTTGDTVPDEQTGAEPVNN